MKITLFISALSIISVVLPIVIAAIQRRKLSKELIPLAWVLIASFLCDLLSIVGIKFAINPAFFGNVYLFIQFTLILYIFSLHHRTKGTLLMVYIIYVIVYIVNIYFEPFSKFQTNSNVAASLILIVLALVFLYRLLNNLPTMHIHKLPMLWLTFGALIYYSGTLFLFLMHNHLVKVFNNDLEKMWILHNLLNVSKNILFAVALWQNYRNYRELKSST